MENTAKPEDIFKDNGWGGYVAFPCGTGYEMETCSGNSDANCHRIRPNYARRLVKKDNSICNDCVYNERK